jgi:hypothetical protein
LAKSKKWPIDEIFAELPPRNDLLSLQGYKAE